MLVSFTLDNFKSFKGGSSLQMAPGSSRSKSNHVKNDCLTLAAIYGNNASGKSNLIQGLKTLKSLVTDPFLSGTAPIYHWDAYDGGGGNITRFCIEFTTKGFLYTYELAVSSKSWQFSNKRHGLFTYPVVYERLSYSDTRYESYLDGTLAETLVFESDSTETPCGTDTTNYGQAMVAEELLNRKELIRKLELCNAADYTYQIRILEEKKDDSRDSDSTIAELDKRRRRNYRYKSEYRNQLSASLDYLDHWLHSDLICCPIVLRSHHNKELNADIELDKDQRRHLENVYNWFESGLVILDTNDIYLPDGDRSLEELSNLIGGMDVGIDGLEWHEVGDLNEKRIIDTMPVMIRMRIDRNLKERRTSGESASFITKTEKGIFRFTFDSKGMRTAALLPKHHDESSRGLYSESDGTVRIIEIASLLIPTEDDVTFIVDEMDRRLHPLLTRKIIEKHLEDDSPSKQLIFSTHETEIFTTDLFRKDEIWIVRKTEGCSEMIALDELHGINYNKRLEKLYLEDRVLPGVPNPRTR